METRTHTKILVVDDDDNFRETLSDAMSLRDVRVSGCDKAADALAQMRKDRPSLILLDVQLPDANGLEFCRKLKADAAFKDVPVVLLSAKFTEPADRAEGLLLGADAYLSKPIDIETIWEEVSYLLDTGE